MYDTRTLTRSLAQVATWFGGKEAFVQAEGATYTYAEVEEEAGRFASALDEAGVEKGDRVAFLTRTTARHAICHFGAMKAGAIPVTLHHREAPGVIDTMIDDLEPAVLLCQPEFDGLVESLRGDAAGRRHVSLPSTKDGSDGDRSTQAVPYEEFVADASTAGPDITIEPDDVAFINLSSGTTSRPKPVVHTHEEAIESAHASGFWEFGRNDRVLNPKTPSFIGWTLVTVPTVNVGGTLVFLEDWDPRRVLRTIDDERVTTMIITPTQYKMLLDEDLDAFDLSSMRQAGYAGETIGTDLLRRIQEELTERVFTVYGTTETLHSGTALLPEEVRPAVLDSVGKPLPNTDVRIIEIDTRNPERSVPAGDEGEVIVRGPAVAEEIWRDPEQTAEIFHEDGWWFSGDRGYVDADGYIYITGRTDNVIISGGINIQAENVEQQLETHPGVVEAAVIGVPDDRWGTAVKAFVVARDPDLTANALEEWCRENESLSDYQRPRSYELVTELPRTNTGKLNRAVLRQSEESDR